MNVVFNPVPFTIGGAHHGACDQACGYFGLGLFGVIVILLISMAVFIARN